MIGKTVTVIVDRPLGSCHPEHPTLYYPVNYGFVPGILAPDGEEQDAYILGPEMPLTEFTGTIIAIVHRDDDIEEKWIVAPPGQYYTRQEIVEQIWFQEQFFQFHIIL